MRARKTIVRPMRSRTTKWVSVMVSARAGQAKKPVVKLMRGSSGLLTASLVCVSTFRRSPATES